MGHPAHHPASYEDLLSLPENLVGEIIHGQLVMHPGAAAPPISILRPILAKHFDKHVPGPGGWWIFREPEVHLQRQILVPDLAGWRRGRILKLPETAFELAPDWACEVLSPITARIDRVKKMPLYADFGVTHVWLVDPVLRTLEAFENDNAVSIAPFDAITFNLAALWAD